MTNAPISVFARGRQTNRLHLSNLYRMHYRKLTAYVRKQRDNFDAEDIVQDAYVRLVHPHAPSEIRRPSTYLYATARHLIADRDRRQYLESSACAALYSMKAVLEFAPDDLLEQRSRLVAVFHAIIRLPEEKCLAFLLARFDETNVREISGFLKIPRSTVQDYIHDVMQACQRARQLDDYEPRNIGLAVKT
ncbi:MAG TPA: RNA polymerase sigma factor [Pedomonas sp.]|uniref:RNA polymerase sigma factor n=1 Tax=Pedomonas sp. TaxID=2976421 RepID=UPI002F3FB502